MPRLIANLLLALSVATAMAIPAAAGDELDAQIREAMRGHKKIPERMKVLAKLAWSEDTASEALAHRARVKLVESGKKSMEAIADALRWAEPARFSDIMLTSIEAEGRITSGDSPFTSSTIDRCIWFGPPDAKRLAMDYMTVRPVGLLMLAVIDSAYDYPELTPVVIDTLALMGDPRARFFLADQLQNGTPAVRKRAAEALATIGGRAREYLRAWALSDDSELRQTAFRALLPVAGVGDLTTLYEYLMLFPEDDPETLDALRARAQLLEDALAAQEELQADTPGLDE